MAPRTEPDFEPDGFEGPTGTEVEARLAEGFPAIREVSPDAVMDRMSARLKRATNLDELFDALTGNSSDALVGRKFEFTGVEWQPYESDRGIIPQAVCAATDLDTGEVTEFVTTAFMLVHFLRQVEVLGRFPFKARIVEKTTKRGQKALNFERV